MSVNIFESEARRAFEAFEAAQRTMQVMDGLHRALRENECRERAMREAMYGPFHTPFQTTERIFHEAAQEYADSITRPVVDVTLLDCGVNPLREFSERLKESVNRLRDQVQALKLAVEKKQK